MKKNRSVFFIFSLLIINFTLLIGIEVGGHLTEDTTWSPNNNPYLVTSVLYVDEDVTLYIEPGTEIFLNAALFNNDTYVQDFAFHENSEPTAKMFWVNGRMIAEGTEQDSILFTRIQQDSTYFKWGIIHISENAELSRFKHCRFEHASTIVINLTFQPSGAIAVQNSVIVDSCYFIDNRYGIQVYYPSLDVKMEVTNSFFTIDEGIDPNTTDWGRAIHIYTPYEHPNRIWIANNEFHNRASTFGELVSVIDNKFTGGGFMIHGNLLPNYAYGNYFYNVQVAISANADEDEAGIYIKNNVVEAEPAFYCEGIKLNNYGYYEVSDNIVYGGIESSLNSSGKVFNNKVHNNPISNSYNGLDLGGYYDIYNNTVINSYKGLNVGWRVQSVDNNIMINNRYALGNLSFSGVFHNNSIFIGNEELDYWTTNDTLHIRNCIIDSIPEGYVISGENNLLIDENQIDSIFVDFANNDFHLIEGSLAIDAGFDTLSYYYPFDMDYNHRIWDGDNNGSAIIDIGPYEFGAPSFGKITGYITETDSGELVDYVLLIIDNEPGNFTFADSSGYFEIQLLSGTYDIYVERAFYEDNVVYSVTVENEQTTEIELNMTSTLPQVGIQENELIINNSELIISNYPNPFNPSTTIFFSVTQNSDLVNLEVYNIKGQKVTTLINEQMQKGKHTTIWSGLDSNNKPVSSGIYFYKIKAGKQESVGRMLLLK
jgi:hypothetical protein